MIFLIIGIVMLTFLVTYIGTVYSLKENSRFTKPGFMFGICAAALAILTVVREVLADINDEEKDKIIQTKQDEIAHQIDVNDSLEKLRAISYADSIALFHRSLVRSDTLHSQSRIHFLERLDDWGLEIRDSNIVRKNPGSPLIVVSRVKVDTLKTGIALRIQLCNQGTSEAFDVKAHFFVAKLVNGKMYSNRLDYVAQDISTGDCLLKTFTYDIGADIKDYYYLIEGQYDDLKKVKRTFQYSYFFDKNLNEWGFNYPPININETIPMP